MIIIKDILKVCKTPVTDMIIYPSTRDNKENTAHNNLTLPSTIAQIKTQGEQSII